MDAAGGSDAFLDDHAVIVLADHAHSLVEDEHLPARRVRRPLPSWRPTTPTRRARASRSARASGSRWPTRSTPSRREETVAEVLGAVDGVEGIDLVMWRDGDDGVVRSARGELRFSPGGACGRRAAGGGGRSRASWASLEARAESGVLRVRRLPGRAGACVVGADVPDGRRRPALGGAGLRVRRLGRRRPRRRREPRLAAPRRLARPAGVVRVRARRPGRHAQWTLRDVLPMVLDFFGVRRAADTLTGMSDEATRVDLGLHVRVRHGLRRQHNWFQLVRFAVVGASGYVVNLAVFTVCVHGLSLDYRLAALVAFLVAVTNNFVWNRHWTFDARDGHAGYQAARFFVVSVAAFASTSPRWSSSCPSAGWPRCPPRPSRSCSPRRVSFAGNKLWSFAQMRRAAAIVSPRPLRSASRRRLRAPPDTPGSAPRDPNALDLAQDAQDRAARRLHDARPFRSIADRAGACRRSRDVLRRHRGYTRDAYLKGAEPLAGLVLREERPGEARKEIGQVLIWDPHGPGARGVDRLPGAVDDGARLPGRVRAQGERALPVDPAVAAVPRRRSSTRGGPSGCCTSTCSCCSASPCRWPSSTTATSASRSRSPTRRCVYLLVRMLFAAAPAARRRRDVVRLLVPASWLAIALVFLLGFRSGPEHLELQRDRRRLRGGHRRRPADGRRAPLRRLPQRQPARRHLRARRTTTPTSPSSRRSPGAAAGTTCPRPTPRRSSSTRSPRCCCGCSGRRIRGPTLGIALAYAWAAFPFTLFTLELEQQRLARGGARRGSRCSSAHRPMARGAAAALAGLTKFAPLALAPMLWTYRDPEDRPPPVADDGRCSPSPSP